MKMLEKVELVREKCGVSYADAKDALERCEGDVLDAIVYLEEHGKCARQTAAYSTTEEAPAGSDGLVPVPSVSGGKRREKGSGEGAFKRGWNAFVDGMRELVRWGMKSDFVIDRDGEPVLHMPVLFLIVALLAWWAAIPLLIAGLFFGLRYHFEGVSPVTVDVNEVMDKAAETAERVKEEVAGKDK